MLEQPKTMITATTKMTTKSATWHARACRAGCSHFFFVSGNLSFVFVVVVDAINAIGLQAS